jgi:hypothetical protein
MSGGRRQRGSGTAAVAFRPIGPIRRRFNRAATEGCGRDAFRAWACRGARVLAGVGLPCGVARRFPSSRPLGSPGPAPVEVSVIPSRSGCIASDHRCGQARSRTHSVRCPRSRYLCPGQCASPGNHTLAVPGAVATFRSGWVRVQPGSDNEAVARLRSLSRPSGLSGLGFGQAATGSGCKGPVSGLGHAEGPDPFRVSGCAARCCCACPSGRPLGQPKTGTGVGCVGDVGVLNFSRHRALVARPAVMARSRSMAPARRQGRVSPLRAIRCGRSRSGTHSLRCFYSRLYVLISAPVRAPALAGPGSGRPSTVRWGWVRVQSGSDNEALCGPCRPPAA